MLTPEQIARKQIDRQLTAAGWCVQDKKRLNLHAAPGIALCETDVDGGFADYMLFVDAKAIGVLVFCFGRNWTNARDRLV